jgi:hypothetical protein
MGVSSIEGVPFFSFSGGHVAQNASRADALARPCYNRPFYSWRKSIRLSMGAKPNASRLKKRWQSPTRATRTNPVSLVSSKTGKLISRRRDVASGQSRRRERDARQN